MHEDLNRARRIASSSDRAFGFVMAFCLSVVAVIPVVRGHSIRHWLLAPVALVTGITLIRPRMLAPFNRLWTNIGLALGRIMNPVVMAIIFFGVITPFGCVMRLLRKNSLQLDRDPEAGSYWIDRRSTKTRSSMTRQY